MAGGFRGGPLWMLRDDSADVVIEIRDSISKQAAWVRAPRVEVVHAE